MTYQSYDAFAVANAFLELAKKDGDSITPMKLQKLVYFAHAWSLVIFNRPLIIEDIRAWQYGPVINSLYHEFKCFGSQAINVLGTRYEACSERFIIPSIKHEDKQTRELIEKVWEEYNGFSAVELSTMTHAQGSAWEVTKDAHKEGKFRDFVLDDQLIKQCLEQETERNVQYST